MRLPFEHQDIQVSDIGSLRHLIADENNGYSKGYNSQRASMKHEVHKWLADLDLDQYADAFADNDIDHRALPLLTEDDLRELGVSLGHRKILLAAIAQLSQDHSPSGTEVSHQARATLADQQSSEVTTSGKRPTASAEAERRLLSILFCDMVGSTAISERLDPEELRDLMRRYQDAVAGCVTRYGGHVAKYLGDGVLAYFGWPMAYEDQAERAVRAGLETLDAISSLNAPGVDQVRARVGVATGQVIVGDLVGDSSREEAAVAGETPNLAARLQDEAEPGTLVVAETTLRLIGTGFESTSLGLWKPKGFQREVNVYQISGERAVESRFEATYGDDVFAIRRPHPRAGPSA